MTLKYQFRFASIFEIVAGKDKLYLCFVASFLGDILLVHNGASSTPKTTSPILVLLNTSEAGGTKAVIRQI